MATLRRGDGRANPLLGVVGLYRALRRLGGREDAGRGHRHGGQRGAVLVVVATPNAQRRRQEGVEPRAQSRCRIAGGAHGEQDMGSSLLGLLECVGAIKNGAQ